MKQFKDWLKENTALDGSVIKEPADFADNKAHIIAGVDIVVGIAPPTGTVVQPTGSASPTGELADALPTIDNSASLSAIKAELAKPGLQEAIAALSPTLSEAIASLKESVEFTPERAGTLKHDTNDFSDVSRNSVGKTQAKKVKAGGKVTYSYHVPTNTTHMFHEDDDGVKHAAVVEGHPSKHVTPEAKAA